MLGFLAGYFVMTWTTSSGNRHGSFKRPAMPEPLEKRDLIDANLRSPICEAHRLSQIGNETCVSLVSHLFFLCCPPTVPIRIGLAWASVWAVVIDAIERVSIRARSHIIQEIHEGAPSIRHRNTATAIVFEPRVLGIRASLHHPIPDFHFTGWKLPVELRTRFSEVFFQAAATTRAMKQIRSGDYPFLTAGAEAVPFPKSLSFAGYSDRFVNDGQSSEDVSDQVVYRMRSHACSYSEGMCVVRGCRPFARSSASLCFIS